MCELYSKKIGIMPHDIISYVLFFKLLSDFLLIIAPRVTYYVTVISVCSVSVPGNDK